MLIQYVDTNMGSADQGNRKCQGRTDSQGITTQLISALKSVDPGAAIIAISGKSPGQLEASKVFGAQRVLTKPIAPADLLAAVEDTVGPSEKETG